jgi:fructose-bisphosphate aldolase, class II
MAFVSLAPLLAHARAGGYAVGAFSTIDFDLPQVIIDAAVALDSPVVVALTAARAAGLDLYALSASVRARAERVAIPVVLHLDHGQTRSIVDEAIDAGFTSVMFDGYGLSLDERRRQTREIIALAHRRGITVEAEMGHITRREDLEAGGPSVEEQLTDPETAVAFARDTGLDCLAVAIGNVHHFAPGTASLDLGRLRAIAASAPCPLSLHGGSGVGDEDLRAAIGAGICKVSYFTQVAAAAVRAMSAVVTGAPVDFATVLETAHRAVWDNIGERLRTLECAGQAAAVTGASRR